MEPEDLLRIVSIACEQLQLPYFVTGPSVTIAYGEPRFWHPGRYRRMILA
jgi:hypothetical protein